MLRDGVPKIGLETRRSGMALIKWTGHDLWEPFQDFAQLPEEVNRLFGQRLLPARLWGRPTTR